MKKELENWLAGLADPMHPDEFEAKQLVRLYGVRVPEGRLIRPEDPVDASGIEPPYAVKVCSPRLFHKTDVEGVRLNVEEDGLERCIRDFRDRFPGTSILVEHQTGFEMPEFITGVLRDATFGPAVMIGAGGVFTELYRDTAFRLAPFAADTALEMLDELSISPVFHGFRGGKLNADRFADLVSSISTLADDMKESLDQLDINPVVFSGGEWIALDVKAVLDPNAPGGA